MVELAEFGDALVVGWFLASELTNQTSQIPDAEAEAGRRGAPGCKGSQG